MPQPLTTILQALGKELSTLGHFTENLQSTIGPALLQLADDPACHGGAQALDLLAQRLAALSGYVLGIGAHVPRKLQVNAHPAASALPLSDLRHRLTSQPRTATEPGTLDLF